MTFGVYRLATFGAISVMIGSPLVAQDTTRITISVGAGRLTGRVTNQISSLPIPFVLISLDKPRTDFFTSEQGRFTLPELGKGEHRMFVRQLGFQLGTEETRVGRDRLVEVLDGDTQVVDALRGHRPRC